MIASECLTSSSDFCRRYEALYVSGHSFSLNGEIDEIVGHTYLFLKEQLQRSTVPPPSGILHGTIIGLASNFCCIFSFIQLF